MSGTDLDIDDAALAGLSEKDIADIVESIDPDVSALAAERRGGVCCVSNSRVWCVCVCVCVRVRVRVRVCVCVCVRVWCDHKYSSLWCAPLCS